MSQYYPPNQQPVFNYIKPPVSPGAAALKRVFGSPAFLVSAILNTIVFILNLISAFVPALSLSSILPNLLAHLPYSVPSSLEFAPYLEQYFSVAQGSSVFSAIIGAIPGFLLLLGLWLIYLSAAKAETPASTAGYTILRVLYMINAVVIAVYTVLFVIIMIIVAIGISSINNDATAFVAMMITMLVLLLVLMLVFFYYLRLSQVYAGAKDLAQLSTTTRRVSGLILFFLILDIISAAILVIGLFALSAITPYFGAGFLLVQAASLTLSFLFSIFQLVVFSKARKEFKALYQYNQPMPAPGAGPQPPYGQNPPQSPYGGNPYQPYQNPQQNNPYPGPFSANPAQGQVPPAQNQNLGQLYGYQNQALSNQVPPAADLQEAPSAPPAPEVSSDKPEDPLG